MIAAGLEFPDDLYYLVEHQVWARLEGEGAARVGITALGMKLAGEIYMCRVKAVGTELEQGRGIGVVELAKSLISVKSPLAGTVLEVNPRLEHEPELVAADPYGAGWLARLRCRDFVADEPELLHGEAVAAAMERHAWLNRVE